MLNKAWFSCMVNSGDVTMVHILDVLDVLTNPNRFFEDRSKEEISLKVPFFIVITYAVIYAIFAYFITKVIMEPFEIIFGSDAIAINILLAVIVALILPFLIWAIFTGVFLIISILFKGDGKFKRIFEFVGYGFIPLGISRVVSLIAIVFYVLPSMTTIQISIDNPEIMKQAMMVNPTMLASSIFGIIMTLWSANIWISGVKHSRNLSPQNALITVVIPVGIYVGYNLFNLYRLVGA